MFKHEPTMEIITKGTAAWNALFKGKETSDVWTKAYDTDKIYTTGDLSKIFNEDKKRIIITGSCDAGPTEKQNVQNILEALSKNNPAPVVVTGLALGVNTFVLEYCLEIGIPAVAVMATGMDDIYPRQNLQLANKMKETPGCTLLTQFPEGTAPIALLFLEKNKTMTMISDMAIIVSSKHHGSSVVISKLMYDLRKKVYALPGRIDDLKMKGCNELIGKGYADILYEYSILEENNF